MIKGEVTVTPKGGHPVKFGASELVTLPAGINYKLDVHKAFRNHYRFGD